MPACSIRPRASFLESSAKAEEKGKAAEKEEEKKGEDKSPSIVLCISLMISKGEYREIARQLSPLMLIVSAEKSE